MFKHTRPKCDWGRVQGAMVPAVTFCHLTFDAAFNFDLGFYEKGFWNQGGNVTLPFLDQSGKGKYVSPPLNGAQNRFN